MKDSGISKAPSETQKLIAPIKQQQTTNPCVHVMLMKQAITIKINKNINVIWTGWCNKDGYR